MRERRQIVELWERGDAAVMATLVRVEGSSYRRTGARLLIAANGDYAGAISGGCLEAEVMRKAGWLVRSGPSVQTYSTLFDDTAEIPYGLGCGGVVHVLLEPAGTAEFETLMLAMKASLAGETFSVTTWLPEEGQPFRREIQPGVVNNEAAQAGDAVFQEVLEPPQRLFVFGAGDDAQPVVRMAALLGWRVIVVDGRAQWAKSARFPEAEQVLAGSEGLRVEARDAAVVMTHSYEQDREWLTMLLPHQPCYLGLLGARHRSALLASEASVMLGWPLEKVCGRLFAPVGLDLGGDGAEAIALAIVAEIQSCVEGKLGRSRRLTPEVIEEQISLGGASRYLQVQCAL
ncbi:MAG TPA: XdhC family protein [Acidobacteriaceae bacterium]|jgi:xanthine/CO dehydrogenase XdhC/CoxF family maturation factor